MSQNNLVDSYEAHGTWFGIVTNGEGGTGTWSNTVIEFTMEGQSPTAIRFLNVNSIGVAA